MSAAIDGSTASFRPSGIARYVGAGFLAFWLAGWALGEAFALTFLFMLLRSILASAAGVSWPIPGGEWIAGGAAGFALLFIVAWLALWTFGGVAALTEFLRLLFGEDRIDIQGTSIEVTRRAGPFRRVRAFDRAVIRRVRLRPKDQAVMLDTAVSSDEITRYGSVEDRKALADWLRQRLALPTDSRVVDTAAAPRDWTMRIEGGSAILNRMDVRSRRIAASILWVITALLALMVLGGLQSGSQSGAAIALVITTLLVFCSSWVTWSEREWLARSGQLTSRVRFLAWQRERSFQHARLRIDIGTDSDGDKHYRLEVHDAEGSKRIASEMNDDADVTDLGRWLSSRTGFPLT